MMAVAMVLVMAAGMIGGIFDKRASFCKKIMKESGPHASSVQLLLPVSYLVFLFGNRDNPFQGNEPVLLS